jgi:hypothetical protein
MMSPAYVFASGMHGSASFSRTINPAAGDGNAIVNGGAEGNRDPLTSDSRPLMAMSSRRGHDQRRVLRLCPC